jgi:acetylornithine/succinyldiaminopimelate/putrescine aminotransferase
MGLSYQEQETVITYNRAEDKMNVYTADKYLLARLKKLETYTMVREYRQDGVLVAADFEADKKLLTLRSKRMVMSEEAKAEAAERLKSSRQEDEENES